MINNRKQSVAQQLSSCIDTLYSIRNSGYWPYASPAPCSTEVEIKKNLDKARAGLETALALHKSMFGRGRDEFSATRTVISEIKP